MSVFLEVERRLEVMEKRRARLRVKISGTAEKLEDAVGRLASALAAVDDSAQSGVGASREFLDALKQNSETDIAALKGRLTAIGTRAQERADAISRLDVTQVAASAEAAAQTFLDGAADQVEDRVNHLINEVRLEIVTRLTAERDAIEDSFEQAESAFSDKVDEWEQRLLAFKSTLNDRLDELTQIDMNQLWYDTGERMQAQFAGEILAVFNRFEALKKKITETLDAIRGITDMFNQAREIKNVGMKGAGTGLETITEIFTDLEEIFSSVV